MIGIRSTCKNVLNKPLNLNYIIRSLTTETTTNTSTENNNNELKWVPSLNIKTTRFINKFGDKLQKEKHIEQQQEQEPQEQQEQQPQQEDKTNYVYNNYESNPRLPNVKNRNNSKKRDYINKFDYQQLLKKNMPSLASTILIDDHKPRTKRSFDLIINNISEDLVGLRDAIKFYQINKSKPEFQKPQVFNTFLQYFSRHKQTRLFEEILSKYKRNSTDDNEEKYEMINLKVPILNTTISSTQLGTGITTMKLSTETLLLLPFNNLSYSIILDFYSNQILNNNNSTSSNSSNNSSTDIITDIKQEIYNNNSNYNSISKEESIEKLNYWVNKVNENIEYQTSLEKTTKEGIGLIISAISSYLTLKNENKAIELYNKIKDSSIRTHADIYLSSKFQQYYSDNDQFEKGKLFILENVLSNTLTPINQIGAQINIDFLIKLFNNESTAENTRIPTSISNNNFNQYLNSIEEHLLKRQNLKQTIQTNDDSISTITTIATPISKPIPYQPINHFYRNILRSLLKKNEKSMAEWVFQNYCTRYKPTYEIYFELLLTAIEQERIPDCMLIVKQMNENSTPLSDSSLEFSILDLCARKRDLSYLQSFIQLFVKSWNHYPYPISTAKDSNSSNTSISSTPLSNKPSDQISNIQTIVPRRYHLLSTFIIYCQINGHDLILSKLKEQLSTFNREKVAYTTDIIIRYLLFINRYDLALHWYGERISTYKSIPTTNTIEYFLSYHNSNNNNKNSINNSPIELVWLSRLELFINHLTPSPHVNSQDENTTKLKLPSLLPEDPAQSKELIKMLVTLDRLTPMGKLKIQLVNSKESISPEQLKEFKNMINSSQQISTNNEINSSSNDDISITNVNNNNNSNNNILNELQREKVDFTLEINMNQFNIEGVYFELQDQVRTGIIKNGISFLKAIQFLQEQDKSYYFKLINMHATNSIRSIVFDDQFYAKVIKSNLEFGLEMLSKEDHAIWRRSSVIWNAVIVGLLSYGQIKLASYTLDCAVKLNKRLISSEIQLGIENPGHERKIRFETLEFIRQNFQYRQEYILEKINRQKQQQQRLQSQQLTPLSRTQQNEVVIDETPKVVVGQTGKKKKFTSPKIDFNTIINDVNKFK